MEELLAQKNRAEEKLIENQMQAIEQRNLLEKEMQ
jgi:hypothetical protein